MDTTVVTLRLPTDLVEWIDGRGKRAAVVTEALEGLRTPKRFALTEDNVGLIRATVKEVLECSWNKSSTASIGTSSGERGCAPVESGSGVEAAVPKFPDVKMNDAMATFLDSAAIRLPLEVADSVEESRLCVSCDEPLRSIRGKWACTDVSCGMAGQEQRGKPSA